MGLWDMDMSRGGAPSSSVDMCRLRPGGIAGRARHRMIGMAAQHILTVWDSLGELGSTDSWQ